MPFVYRLCWLILQPLVKLFFRFSVTGLEHLPKSGAVVIACNHASYLDPPLVALALTRQTYFLARQSLFRNRLFGGFIRYFGAYPVSRSDARGMLTALRILKEAKPLLVFPEGTRTLDGKLQTIKTGAAWLAVHSQCSIVPVWIQGSYKALPKGSSLPKPAKITVVIGEPINPNQDETLDKEQRISAATQTLQLVFSTMENHFLSLENKSRN